MAVPCLVSLLIVFVIVFALAVCGHAQSGYPGGPHYDVTYGGGTVTSTGGPYPVVFRSNNDQYNSNDQTYGGGDVAYSPPGSGAGPNVTCSGKITATCTWVPTAANEPPPASAIVEEDGTARYATSPDYSGTCDDGLGDLPVYGSNFGSSSGTRYTVKSNPGASFTLTCSPSAIASTTQDGAYASASVSYKATAYPVTINPLGTTKNGSDYDLLTGQQVTATLNAPYQVDPYSYSWDASNVFKNYDTNLTSNQFVPLGDADYFKPSFVFYDATHGILALKCSATVVCPDGTRLNVNVQQPITILKPTETAWNISATNAPDGPFFYDYSNGTYNPQYGVQVIWHPITITVPSPFMGGQVCLAQIANFNRVDTRVAVNGASNTYVVTPATQGLDTGFPYLIAYQVDGQGNIVMGNNNMYAVLLPPLWNVNGSGPTIGAGGDSPVHSCEPDLVSGDTGGEDWRSSTDTDQFDTWTMYRPPAVGSQPTVWVPLQTIHWAWSGSASVHTDAAGNVIVDNNGYTQWFFTIPQVNPVGTPADTTGFPTWTTIIPYGLTMGPPAAH